MNWNPEPTRRQFIKATGMAGVVGASRSFFPSWMPRLAFRNQEGVSGAPGDVLIHIFFVVGWMD